MSVKKYIGYTTEELLHDHDFVSIVKNMNSEKEWEQFLLRQTPAQGDYKNIIEAREIVLSFKVREDSLSYLQKMQLWENIYSFYSGFLQKRKNKRIGIFIRIAASVIVFLAIGSILLLFIDPPEKQYHFTESREGFKTENPVLFLLDGKTVQLESAEPEIEVLKDHEAISIDKEKIVENSPSVGAEQNEARLNEIIVPYGKRSTLVLEDGTRVWLNSGSRFAFPQKFEGKRREVILEGEAYFEVAKAENKPFIVSADHVFIEVIGTKFFVSACKTDEFNEAVLIEGSVGIKAKSKLFGGNKVVMESYQIAVYNKQEKSFEVKPEPDPQMYIAWIGGWYPFVNENLEKVLKKLERYYNVTFKYDSPFISKALSVTGKLDIKDSFGEVMMVLSRVAKFDYIIQENQVIIF